MNKELLGFLFKLFLLSITLYFTCEFALKSKNMNTHISIITVIAVTIIVCVLFLVFGCKKSSSDTGLLEGGSNNHKFLNKDLFDFVLKVLLISVTIYFICDFAEKATTMNTRISIISVMILTIIICVLFLFFKKDSSSLLSPSPSSIV